MDNRNKHIDDLFSEKANAHKADTNFAKIDFEAIKAKLPTAAAVVATPKAKPTSWFGLNTTLITVGIIVAIGFIIMWNKGTFSNTETNKTYIANNNSIISYDTLQETTNEILKDTTKSVATITKRLNDTKVIDIIDTNKTNGKANVKGSRINNLSAVDDAKENLLITQTFFGKLSNASQFFTINASKDTNIICSNGTALNIKANSFTNQNKVLVKGMVQLEIKEAYSFNDVIAHGLHTVSNSNLLESAGMIFINAKQNDQALDINIRQPIQITMASTYKKDDMQLFYLDKNANENLLNTKTNWIANGQMQNEKQAFLIRNLGWLNSSHFSTKNIEKTSIKIQLQNETDSNAIKAMLIFSRLKSVINLYYKNGTLIQQKLPIGEEAYFVSFKITNGKTVSIIQKITITKDIIQAEDFKDIPAAQVKAKLNAIGTLQ
jgi:hypothetical protein